MANIDKETDGMISVESDEPNKEQVGAFNAGKPLVFTGGENDSGLSEDALADMAAMDEMDLSDILPPDEDTEVDSDTVAVPVLDDTAPHDVEYDPDVHGEHDIIVKSGITEINKFKIPHPVRNAILLCCAFMLAFALGFACRFLLTADLFPGSANRTAASSVKAVLTRIPQGQEFLYYQVFIKRDVDNTECIIFGALSNGANDYMNTYYRLIISNTDSSNAVLYRPFDSDEYDRLTTGSDEERLRAGTMMNYYENFLRSVNEINSGSERWIETDLEYVKRQIAKSK